MTRTMALAGAFAAIVGICLCARQAPQNETLEGTLEDINDTVAVVKDPNGKEHMFWILPEVKTDVKKGDRVILHYSTQKGTGRKVKNLLDIRKNEQ